MERILIEISDVCQPEDVPTHFSAPLHLASYGRVEHSVVHFPKFRAGNSQDEVVFRENEEGLEFRTLTVNGDCYAFPFECSKYSIREYTFLQFNNHVQQNVSESQLPTAFDHLNAFDRFRQFVPKLKNTQSWETYSSPLTSRINMVNNSLTFLESTDLPLRQVRDLTGDTW